MATMSLPPGFRFHPTDDELIGYYLKRRVDNLKIELDVIPVIDLYKCEPWELPEKSFLPNRDLEWFFFVPRDRKYPNGSRTNRATSTGYWKATGKDRKVSCDGVCGVRKTLVFYMGRAPGGERTDWVMHEYRLCQDLLHGASTFIGSYALVRVIKRSHADPAKAPARVSGGQHQRVMMSTVSSSSSMVTAADHQLTTGAAGGESWCDVTTPDLYTPPPHVTSAPPFNSEFFIGDGVGGDEPPHSHMSLLGDMIPAHHELTWVDDLPSCDNTFSATAVDIGEEQWWDPQPTAPAQPPALLCRQASDGVDDLMALWFSSVADENMVVF